MTYGVNMMKKNKTFSAYIFSQAISALGDSFQFIAITALLMKITGSGIFAGFSIIFTTAASILFLPIAAIIGDKFSEKYFVVSIDVLRGLLVLLFINEYSNVSIFVLLLVLSVLDALYNPPRRKMISNILESNEILEGNSILVGVTGIVFMIGAAAAGVMINQWNINMAFVIKSISFFISAIILTSLKIPNTKYRYRSKEKCGSNEAIMYLNNSIAVREIVIIGTIIVFCTALANIAFYNFVFDTLLVSSKDWGIMMSLFCGTSLLGMLLASRFGKISEKSLPTGFYISLIFVSFSWVLYGLTMNLTSVVFLQVLEGTALSFSGIVLISCLQRNIKNSIMARIIGINDMINNLGKILGVSLGFILLNNYDYRTIFIANGSMLAAFALYKWVFEVKLSKKRF